MARRRNDNLIVNEHYVETSASRTQQVPVASPIQPVANYPVYPGNNNPGYPANSYPAYPGNNNPVYPSNNVQYGTPYSNKV